MDGYEKNLLEFASLLHDIGRYRSDENHHIAELFKEIFNINIDFIQI